MTASKRRSVASARRLLWTPWRLPFILGGKSKDCIFCTKPAETQDTENYVLERGPHCFVMLNAYPYTNGHLLIAPYRHVPSPQDLTSEQMADMTRLLNVALDTLTACLKPQGFNVGMNLGAVAGAGIADHVHLHIVPRWQGDTNFMPVLDGVRMIPERLEDTYDRLRTAWPSQ